MDDNEKQALMELHHHFKDSGSDEPGAKQFVRRLEEAFPWLEELKNGTQKELDDFGGALASSPYDENGFKPFVIKSDEAAKKLIALMEEHEPTEHCGRCNADVPLGSVKFNKDIGVKACPHCWHMRSGSGGAYLEFPEPNLQDQHAPYYSSTCPLCGRSVYSEQPIKEPMLCNWCKHSTESREVPA